MKRRSKLLAVLSSIAVVGTLGVLGITSALAATASPIKGLGGKCVDVVAAATANGTAVDLYDCNGTGAQTWTTGNSDNTIKALGKCLDVAAAATTNGAKVQIYDCNGTAAQKWTVANGALVNTGSGKCLDATGQSSANGTVLQIWSCTGAANQTFVISGGGTTPTTPPTTAPTTAPPSGLNPNVAPGGNFNLLVWQLQLPTGSPGSPDTISSSQLKGANGYTNPAYFFTDKNDGSMTFFAPEKGVTTPNSNYARSELREMNSNGSAANWSLSGTHKLNANLRITQVTKNVCVGQVHLGTGGSSTKPLLELYYRPNGDVILGTENSPDGGQTLHTLGNVALGTKWSYVIQVSGNTIKLTVNGSTTSYSIPSSFNPYKQYFKAGSYNQSSSDSSTNGAKVKFYSLTISHS